MNLTIRQRHLLVNLMTPMFTVLPFKMFSVVTWAGILIILFLQVGFYRLLRTLKKVEILGFTSI